MASSEENIDIFSNIIHLLENFDYVAINQIVEEKNNVNSLKQITWDLVPKICSYLTPENESNQEFIDSCDKLLNKLTEIGSAKEMLLILLEQLDGVTTDLQLIMLLGPIQSCLLALPKKRGQSLCLTLETVYACVNHIAIPNHFNQIEDEERKLLDINVDVCRICHIISEVLSFVKPFVQDDKLLNTGRREISKFLIKLLDYPIGHLDLNKEGQNFASKMAAIADNLLHLIALLETDFYKLIEEIQIHNERLIYLRKNTLEKQHNEDEYCDDIDLEEPVPKLGLAIFAYLAFMHVDQYVQNKPKVFTVIHLLDITSSLIIAMLLHDNILIKEKGVALLENILSTSKHISSECYSWQDVKMLVDGLIKVMCNSKSKKVAQKSLACYAHLYAKCESDRKFLFMFYIFTNSHHSGLLGYTVTLLKDEVNRSVLNKDNNCAFRPPKVLKLFKITFNLVNKEKTDILENIDHIMSTLNFLRYLVMSDKPVCNQTGFWSVKNVVCENFLQPLRLGLDMSRAHYNLDLEQLSSKSAKNTAESHVEVSIAGQLAMPDISKDEKLKVLRMALNRFDMLESVLVRVEELMDLAGKN